MKNLILAALAAISLATAIAPVANAATQQNDTSKSWQHEGFNGGGND